MGLGLKGFCVWVLSEILAVICSNVTALMTPRLCSKIRDNGNQKSKDDIVSMKRVLFFSISTASDTYQLMDV